MVAGDDHQDFARAGNRHAQPPAHRLPGGFGGRQSALPGRHFPRTVRRGPDLPLQLADAPQTANSADCGGDGAVHRGRRLSSRAQRLHHHGGRHQLHGAGRTQPGEGRDRPGDRFRTAGRRAHAHHGQRRGALSGEGRCRLPGAHSPAISPIARRGGESAEAALLRRATRRNCAVCCPPTIACRTKSKTSCFESSMPPTMPNSSRNTRRRCCARTRGWKGGR